MNWQKIETAPTDGTEVLLYVRRRGGGNYISAKNVTGKQWWATGTGAVIPSHWMPLPPPPIDED